MIDIVLDILILIFATLTYRDLKLKKSTVKQDDNGWPIMNAYRDSAKAQRERKADVKTDPNEPEFGQGWFPYTVRRDLEEMKRQREQHHDKTS